MWDLLPRPTGDHVLRVFARTGDSFDGDYITRFSELERFARAHRDRNVYIAPNPTCSRTGTRHTADDVTHWSYFLIDMDPVEPESDPLMAISSALVWLGEWVGKTLTGATVIDSGRGAQAWIRLEDVLLADTEDAPGGGVRRKDVRRVNGYWLQRMDRLLGTCHGCRIDTSVSDLPRVMRCPGTWNLKTGRMARFLQVQTEPVRGLARLLMAGTPPEVMHEADVVTEDAGLTWQRVFPRLTLSAQSYLLLGHAEPGRHKALWHTVTRLREQGLTLSAARKAVKRANKLRGPDEALPDEELERIVEGLYRS